MYETTGSARKNTMALYLPNVFDLPHQAVGGTGSIDCHGRLRKLAGVGHTRR
jgi:hypothetical protein